MAFKEESKKASDLSVEDIGKHIFGHHGARGLRSGKSMPSWNRIESITFTRYSVEVTVLRSRYTTSNTHYGISERVKLKDFSYGRS